MKEPEVVLTHTAKSKAFRYLKSHEIAQYVLNANAAYYDELRGNYKLRVDREQHQSDWNHGRTERIVLIVEPLPDESKYLVVSQTGDHYDWGEYEKVGGLPEVV